MKYIKRNETFCTLLFLLFSSFLFVWCGEIFERETTGVSFSPYAKVLKENQVDPNSEYYTSKDIHTMIKVIYTKFSKIISIGSPPRVLTGEVSDICEQRPDLIVSSMAALHNKNSKNLSKIQIIHEFSADSFIPRSEVTYDLECLQNANLIFPGTVVGVMISTDLVPQKLNVARQMLQFIRHHINQTNQNGLKIGARQKCEDVDVEFIFDENVELTQTRRNILNESDFIICELMPESHNLLSGAQTAFSSVKDILLEFRRQYKSMNPTLEIMGQTRWPSKGSEAYENIENLKNYWKMVDAWAAQTNITMYLHEAFDQPWKRYISPNASHHGWWKLTSNSDSDKEDAYIEKINDPTEFVEQEIIIMQSSQSNNLLAYFGISVGGFVFVVASITTMFLLKKMKTLKTKLRKNEIQEFFNGSENFNEEVEGARLSAPEQIHTFPYNKHYEINRENLHFDYSDILGTGQFGIVVKATVFMDNEEQATEVALKIPKSGCSASTLRGFLSEIKILIYLGKHKNLVSITGAYTAELESGVIYLATELCNKGSLEKHLRRGENHYENVRGDGSGVAVTVKDMMKWTLEVCLGMEYLAGKNVVHADLATRNILLDTELTAKITDFGLSRRLYNYASYVKKKQEPLPWRWMSIEVLKRLEFSSQSDVWSFGVTLWEIFSMGDIPYPGINWHAEFVELLWNGLRMKRPRYASPEIYYLMLNCWHVNPGERPTFSQMKITISNLLHNNTS